MTVILVVDYYLFYYSKGLPKWMNPGNIALSQISHEQEEKCTVASLTYNI